MTKLFIFGDSSFAIIAKEYFERDGKFVEGFVVEDNYKKTNELEGKPVFKLSTVLKDFDRNSYMFFVAVVYTQVNKLRTRIYENLVKEGFKPISYISPNSFIDPTSIIGDHVFIFENNVIQAFTEIGDNTILWSGNHIGHHSVVGKNNFFSSHVVLSGHCKTGLNCFFGVNSSINNNLNVGDFNWVMPKVNIHVNTKENEIWQGERAKKFPKSTKDFFKID